MCMYGCMYVCTHVRVASHNPKATCYPFPFWGLLLKKECAYTGGATGEPRFDIGLKNAWSFEFGRGVPHVESEWRISQALRFTSRDSGKQILSHTFGEEAIFNVEAAVGLRNMRTGDTLASGTRFWGTMWRSTARKLRISQQRCSRNSQQR